MQAAHEVSPGVFRIELPLPFELHSVNVYLVRLSAGYLLIDCGMETKDAFAALLAGVQTLGIGWADIRRILLTHMHPDHMGMSARLLELTGAELLMHDAEARQLQLVAREKKRLPWIERAFERAGVPAALQSTMDAHFLQIRRNLHDLTPDRILFGGEDIDTAMGPLRTHWTPGHSPGHLCLYSPARKLLFSGDVMLEHITPNISWDPHTDALADFLGSLAGLGELEIDLILPSHGDPFSGHRSWIAETVCHHRERCDQIYGLVSSAPRTAHLLVGELWRKELSPINRHFAVFEVLAHLEHMQRQGRVHTREHEGALEWRA